MSEPEVKKAKVDENAEVTDVAVEAAENAAPGEEVDAALEAIAEEPPSTSGWKDHKMNIAEAVTIDVEGDSFGNIAEAPITVLQGLGPKAEEIMTALGLKSVKELAENKFFKIARAIVVLEALEKEDKRPAKSIMNIDTAVVSEYEAKTLGEICAAPVSALQGLSATAKDLLNQLGVDTVEKLGTWKYATRAEAIVTLAEYEHEKDAEQRKKATLLKRLQ